MFFSNNKTASTTASIASATNTIKPFRFHKDAQHEYSMGLDALYCKAVKASKELQLNPYLLRYEMAESRMEEVKEKYEAARNPFTRARLHKEYLALYSQYHALWELFMSAHNEKMAREEAIEFWGARAEEFRERFCQL